MMMRCGGRAAENQFVALLGRGREAGAQEMGSVIDTCLDSRQCFPRKKKSLSTFEATLSRKALSSVGQLSLALLGVGRRADEFHSHFLIRNPRGEASVTATATWLLPVRLPAVPAWLPPPTAEHLCSLKLSTLLPLFLRRRRSKPSSSPTTTSPTLFPRA